MAQVIEKMSLNPAKLYHLECGRMKAGRPADIVIFDIGENWIVKQFHSKSSNSPFVGRWLKGKVKWTICNGKVAYEDGKANA